MSNKVEIKNLLERDFPDANIKELEDAFKFTTKTINTGQLLTLARIVETYGAAQKIGRSGLGLVVIISY